MGIVASCVGVVGLLKPSKLRVGGGMVVLVFNDGAPEVDRVMGVGMGEDALVVAPEEARVVADVEEGVGTGYHISASGGDEKTSDIPSKPKA